MEMPEVPHQKNGMCLSKNKADHQFRVILYIYILKKIVLIFCTYIDLHIYIYTVYIWL